MAKRKQTHARLYWRTRSDGAPRAWGDFREYAAQGGKREPLVASGESRATTDPVLAQSLFAARLGELASARENETRAESVRKKPTIAEVVKEHIAAWEQREGHHGALARVERRLSRPGRHVLRCRAATRGHHDGARGGVDRVAPPVRDEAGTADGRGDGAASFGRAVEALPPRTAETLRRGRVQPSEPTRRSGAAQAATVRDAVPRGSGGGAPARREFSHTYPVKKHEPEMALAYPLIAAFLLTGGRQKEVLGLRLQDVSTDRNTVTFRPNEFHEGGRLETQTSTRTVPLWPQSGRRCYRYSTNGRLRAGGCCSGRRTSPIARRRLPTSATCWIGSPGGLARRTATFGLGCSGSPMRPRVSRRSTTARQWRPGRWRRSWGTPAGRCWKTCTADSGTCGSART